MNAQMNALLAAFDFVRERKPDDLLSAIRALPDPGALPSPWIRYEMDRVHDQVMKLKDVVPPEPQGSRPWWRLWGQ
jgi:hypothetical protein